eukprot:678436-Pelagomonas_calceolata.AAC.2
MDAVSEDISWAKQPSSRACQKNATCCLSLTHPYKAGAPARQALPAQARASVCNAPITYLLQCTVAPLKSCHQPCTKGAALPDMRSSPAT